MKNLFIMGPVAAGKTTIMNLLNKENEYIVLDTGKIYRFITRELLSYLKEQGYEIGNKENDAKKLYTLRKFVESRLNTLTYDNDKFYTNNIEVDPKYLYMSDVNDFIGVVAGVKTIRTLISKYIDNSINDKDNKPIILTGHNFKEIDTTKFTVIFLDIDEKMSADRLINRNPKSYNNFFEAYKEVISRNLNDGIDSSKLMLNYLYNYIYIDTTYMVPSEIVEHIKNQETRIADCLYKFTKNQINAVNRDDFTWIFHPVLSFIKPYIEQIICDLIDEQYDYINKNDLLYQTLINITAHPLSDVFPYLDEFNILLDDSLITRNLDDLEKLRKILKNCDNSINTELLNNVCKNEFMKLVALYENLDNKDLIKYYNQDHTKGRLAKKEGVMYIKDDNNDEISNLSFRQLRTDESTFLSTYCHYLHTPRNDEYISYGAFIDDSTTPIAFVSYSKQDRKYKQELLYNMGIEPQNTLEMTRAWCSNNAPTNLMSSLFQFSITEIQNNWKNAVVQNLEDKELQAITTTINPNLGFKASSFLGCNFLPIAFRPAKFTFTQIDDIIYYMTRRQISCDMDYFENQISILPLNEMILCFNKNIEDKIRSSGIIYNISKRNYENINTHTKRRKFK